MKSKKKKGRERERLTFCFLKYVPTCIICLFMKMLFKHEKVCLTEGLCNYISSTRLSYLHLTVNINMVTLNIIEQNSLNLTSFASKEPY